MQFVAETDCNYGNKRTATDVDDVMLSQDYSRVNDEQKPDSQDGLEPNRLVSTSIPDCA